MFLSLNILFIFGEVLLSYNLSRVILMYDLFSHLLALTVQALFGDPDYGQIQNVWN